MKYPFETPFAQVEADLDAFVDAVFSCLESEFLVLPKGPGFIEYPVFEHGYEALKRATSGFVTLDVDRVSGVVLEVPISLVVLRTILGLSPPEWAYVATETTGIEVTQGAVRSIDRGVRMSPHDPLSGEGITGERIKALVSTACKLLSEGRPNVPEDCIHRLDKADTRNGLASLRPFADMGVPYAMVLYERFLGRPFAAHRDSVSEMVGDRVESAIEDVLTKAGVSYRKTKRAETIEGFDQAPDFVIPSEFNPKVVIEAKLTEDDGTARDKVTRIQHLGELSTAGRPAGKPKFEVIACIAGRGFRVRREDMKKMLLATRGKVLTLKNLDRLVECTRIRRYKSRP